MHKKIIFRSYKRIDKKCPLCGESVKNLVRHLTGNKKIPGHLMSREKCKEFLAKSNLRKTYTFTNKEKSKKRSYNVAKFCPVDGCSKVLENVYEHLLGYHRFERSDREYMRLIRIAKSVGEILSKFLFLFVIFMSKIKFYIKQ